MPYQMWINGTHTPGTTNKAIEVRNLATEMLHQVAQKLTERTGEFARLLTLEGGKSLGEEGLDEFRETKHVYWDFEGAMKPWWNSYGKE